MSEYWLAFLTLLVVGAIASPGTLLHSIALALDLFVQAFFWNDPVGITISSRAGLAARNGYLWPAKFVNLIMFSDTHCEDAIQSDIERADQALKVLKAL